MAGRLDCLLIGYYEPPFGEYERLVRRFGPRSEAYRDLEFSFVNVGDQKLDYVGLMNRAYDRSHGREPRAGDRPTFVSGEIPNLGAVYLCAFLRRHGFEAEYVNLL